MDPLDRLFEELTTTKRLIETRGVPWWGGYITAILYNQDPSSHWSWTQMRKHVNTTDIVFENLEGKMHRTTGPAYINRACGSEEWYKNGILHRDGGPAITHGQVMLWYKDGKLHNNSGPAIVDPAGPYQYFIDGVKYSPKQYKKEIARRIKRGIIKNEESSPDI